MTTPAELHPDGDYFPGLNSGVVVVFTDRVLETKVNPSTGHVWHGVIKRVKGGFTTGLSINRSNGWFTQFYLSSIGETNSDNGQNLQVFIGSHKIVSVFFVNADGPESGVMTFTIGGVPSVGWYWVRPPGGDPLAGRATHDEWFNYEMLDFLSDPASTTQHSFSISAPRWVGIRQSYAVMRASVTQNQSVRAGVAVQVRDTFTRANTTVRIGRRAVTRAGTKARVGQHVPVRVSIRVRVGATTPVRAAVVIHVVNSIVRAKIKAKIGKVAGVHVVVRVRVFRQSRIGTILQVHVVFINVEDMKLQMQILFGSDTALVVKTFTTVPVVTGVAFTQNLEHVLILPGTETVRRLNVPVWSAAGLYEIDHVLGRFRWLGESAESIELTYRHSTLQINDANIVGSIIKASSFIQERLKPNANLPDPRFRRGGAELAMSFLLDAAIWNVTNALSTQGGGAAVVGTRRVDLMQTQKREFERRAYETLGPFLVDPVPGMTRRAALARPKAIQVYEG